MLVLCNSRHSQEKEVQYLNELSHRSVDGILLATPHLLPEDYSLKSGFFDDRPIILVDRGSISGQWSFDRERIRRRLPSRQLFDQNGHRNIAMLKEITGYYQLEERFNGYRHALKDHQIPLKADM